MTVSKLIRKVFKRHSKAPIDNDKTAVTKPSTHPCSTRLSSTRQQQLQNLEPHSQPSSLFFSLPGELRNKIYSFATYPSLDTITIYQNADPVFSPNIFHICRRMRSEAIAQLCASKSIYLSGLRTTNTFFEIVRDAMSSLRHVTIRSQSAWRSEAEEMKVERSKLIDFLELTTGLKDLTLVVGGCPLHSQDEENFKNSRSVGARFLFAVRTVVDGVGHSTHEDEVARKNFLALCEQAGPVQARGIMKMRLRDEHEQREDQVFKLQVYNETRVEGGYERIDLPVRIPDYLRD